MKNPVPIIIILVATFFFILELAKESSWEVKAETPMYHKVDAPNTTHKIGLQPLGMEITPSRIAQPCPTLGVVSHTLFFMGL